MKSLGEDELAQFRSLVEATDRHTEVQCSPYLEAAISMLLPTFAMSASVIKERRNSYGSGDYLIIADIQSGHGTVEKHAYYFELKAPQALLMKKGKSKTQFYPSDELIKAETQLIHYVDQARKDDDLREHYDIKSKDCIIAGGIIIGRDGRYLVTGSHSEQSAAEQSFRKRKMAVYDKMGIKICTWDRVLEYLLREKTVRYLVT